MLRPESNRWAIWYFIIYCRLTWSLIREQKECGLDKLTSEERTRLKKHNDEYRWWRVRWIYVIKTNGYSKYRWWHAIQMNTITPDPRDKFGFTFVICARENKAAAILEGLDLRWFKDVFERFAILFLKKFWSGFKLALWCFLNSYNHDSKVSWYSPRNFLILIQINPDTCFFKSYDHDSKVSWYSPHKKVQFWFKMFYI